MASEKLSERRGTCELFFRTKLEILDLEMKTEKEVLSTADKTPYDPLVVLQSEKNLEVVGALGGRGMVTW